MVSVEIVQPENRSSVRKVTNGRDGSGSYMNIYIYLYVVFPLQKMFYEDFHINDKKKTGPEQIGGKCWK